MIYKDINVITHAQQYRDAQQLCLRDAYEFENI